MISANCSSIVPSTNETDTATLTRPGLGPKNRVLGATALGVPGRDAVGEAVVRARP